VAHHEDLLAHGINDFVICCGYKGYVIKEYFANYFLHMSDVTFDMRSNRMEVHQQRAEPWRVTLVDTGEHTDDRRPPARVAAKLRGGDEAFCFTYGDGVADVDISATGRLPPRARQGSHAHRRTAAGRFGALDMDGKRVARFRKSRAATAAGSTAASSCSPKVIDLIAGDTDHLGAASR
jgi:glucose-1-phosphate cytidylyltransferase